MSNKKIKIILTAFAALAILTTGCGISVTSNYYCLQPDHQEELSANKTKENNIPVDTLKNTANAFN